MYLNFFEANRRFKSYEEIFHPQHLRMVEVEFRRVLASGFEGKAEVIVAEEIKVLIPEVVDILSPLTVDCTPSGGKGLD